MRAYCAGEGAGPTSPAPPRLGIRVTRTPDLVTPKLAALREYQLSLMEPVPPEGSLDRAAAERGGQLFRSKARCATCHVPERGFSDVNLGRVHAPGETGMSPAYAERTATRRYRTTPLRGAWQHPPYFHDGSAATLADVVAHYDSFLRLGLPPQERTELAEYLKSL